jgi:hypothetical protein
MSSTDLIQTCSLNLWEGHVPIRFILSDTDITATEVPDAVYVMASRFSYLPIVAADVVHYFQQSAIEFSSEVWFECNGKPLQRYAIKKFNSFEHMILILTLFFHQ